MRGEPDVEMRAKVCGFLDELGIEYTCMEHAPAMTMEDCRAVDEALGVNMCKNLFLCNRQQTNFYLLLMPGDKPFKTKDLSAQLGVARLSFGTPEHMQAMLGVTPGSVSVLGLLQDQDHQVRLLIDEDVLKGERFACHPCDNRASLCFSTKDLMDKILPALGHSPKLVQL
ncbi:MAG: prolyl-tRNA synthetase associated domain-containing protein [Clostridia bacterium]|nr:prolyl-tRNA synthetase associated domain-containing protein [Clostridia bacterium]